MIDRISLSPVTRRSAGSYCSEASACLPSNVSRSPRLLALQPNSQLTCRRPSQTVVCYLCCVQGSPGAITSLTTANFLTAVNQAWTQLRFQKGIPGERAGWRGSGVTHCSLSGTGDLRNCGDKCFPVAA